MPKLRIDKTPSNQPQREKHIHPIIKSNSFLSIKSVHFLKQHKTSNTNLKKKNTFYGPKKFNFTISSSNRFFHINKQIKRKLQTKTNPKIKTNFQTELKQKHSKPNASAPNLHQLPLHHLFQTPQKTSSKLHHHLLKKNNSNQKTNLNKPKQKSKHQNSDEKN